MDGLLRYDVDISPPGRRSPLHLPILADPTSSGTGAGLWRAGEELARFLTSLPRPFARATVALELGCGGAAAPSRALAWRGGRAVATDVASVLDLTRANVAADGNDDRVAVAALDWAAPDPAAAVRAALGGGGTVPSLILAADVAYDPAAWPPLLATLAAAAAAGPPPARSAPVLLALPSRPESAGFLPTAVEAGWGWRPLRACPATDDPPAARVDILQMWRAGGRGADHHPCPVRPLDLWLSDFDHSLVEGNVDTAAAAALGPASQAALEQTYAAGAGWTAAMAAALAAGPAAAAEAGAAGVPMAPEVKAALAAAAAARPAVSVVIVSDANARLIDAALRAHGVEGCADGVVTNPAGVAGPGHMAVEPFHSPAWCSSSDEEDAGGGGAPPAGGGGPSSHFFRPRRAPHACAACPPNLCKAAVVEAVLAARAPGAPPVGRVMYLGDGANDACPATRCLGPGDTVLARRAYPGGRPAPLAGAMRAVTEDERAGPPPRVVEWEAAREAGEAVCEWLRGEVC